MNYSSTNYIVTIFIIMSFSSGNGMNNHTDLVTQPRFVAYPTQKRCVIAGYDGLVVLNPISHKVILHTNDSIIKMSLLYNRKSPLLLHTIKTWSNQWMKEYDLSTGKLTNAKLLPIKLKSLPLHQKQSSQRKLPSVSHPNGQFTVDIGANGPMFEKKERVTPRKLTQMKHSDIFPCCHIAFSPHGTKMLYTRDKKLYSSDVPMNITHEPYTQEKAIFAYWLLCKSTKKKSNHRLPMDIIRPILQLLINTSQYKIFLKNLS